MTMKYSEKIKELDKRMSTMWLEKYNLATVSHDKINKGLN
jgi:hypothetical protein